MTEAVDAAVQTPAPEAAVESRGLIRRSKSGHKEAWEKANAYAQTQMPIVPSKPGKEAYDKGAGKRFSLFAPAFSKEKPNLADLSVGVSLYFSLLWKMTFLFFFVGVICIPSLFITFFAVPSWAEDERGINALKKFSIGAMVKPSSTDPYGCDMEYCTFPRRAGYRAAENPDIKCRALKRDFGDFGDRFEAECAALAGCEYLESCGGCVVQGSTCIKTESLLMLIVWMDMICMVVLSCLVPFMREHVDAVVKVFLWMDMMCIVFRHVWMDMMCLFEACMDGHDVYSSLRLTSTLGLGFVQGLGRV